MEEELKEYTIRSRNTGAIECRGYWAYSAEQALDDFYEDRPRYKDGSEKFYASEAKWND